MPYFARLNDENIVTFVERVVGVPDGDAEGEAFLRGLYGTTDRFRFCKFDGTQRGRFPGVGYKWDDTAQVFIAPSPFPSWTLDENYEWQPPTPMPNDGQRWRWDETTLSWVI